MLHISQMTQQLRMGVKAKNMFVKHPEIKIEMHQRKTEALQRMSDEIVKDITETRRELEKVSKAKADLSDTEWYLRRKICDLETKMEQLSHKNRWME